MPHAKHLLVMMSGLVLVASLFLLAIPNVAQSIVLTPNDMQLTITSLFSAATQRQATQSTLAANSTETVKAFQSTRTAIAATREPYLLTPQPPNSIELTATDILATQTAMFAVNPETGIQALYLTVTAMSHEQPQAILPTDCHPFVGGFIQQEVSSDFQNTLHEANIDFADAGILVVGVKSGCEDDYAPLQTKVGIQIMVSDLSDETLLITIENILAALQKFQLPETYKNVRFQIAFYQSFFAYRFVDTSYANALAAYAEGLRGDALIEALGGILDG